MAGGLNNFEDCDAFGIWNFSLTTYCLLFLILNLIFLLGH